VGTLAEWLDFDLIDYIVENRKDYSFVFIGPIGQINISKIRAFSHPNVYLLSTKPHKFLPNYLAYIDVCILSRVSDFCRAVDSVKIYEYLAAGKQVVATDMPELYKFNSVIKIAKSKEEFTDLLDQALKDVKESEEHIRKCTETLKEHTWQKRVAKIESLIVENLENLKSGSRDTQYE
jgi:glycosyltransferase involved in cell wall biosynthesis